jgi:hypothetical protein
MAANCRDYRAPPVREVQFVVPVQSDLLGKPKPRRQIVPINSRHGSSPHSHIKSGSPQNRIRITTDGSRAASGAKSFSWLKTQGGATQDRVGKIRIASDLGLRLITTLSFPGSKTTRALGSIPTPGPSAFSFPSRNRAGRQTRQPHKLRQWSIAAALPALEPEGSGFPCPLGCYQRGDGCDCGDLDQRHLYGDDRGCFISSFRRNHVARNQVQPYSGRPGIART